MEFNKNKKEELELFNILQRYSNPAAYIKDVLRGLLPIPGATVVVTQNNHQQQICNQIEDDNEDLMDI